MNSLSYPFIYLYPFWAERPHVGHYREYPLQEIMLWVNLW